jgi:hypothetical protein
MPASHYACQSPLNKIVLILRRACGVIFERHRAGGEHQHQWAGSRAVHPCSIHGLGYLFSALRREGLIADELVLQPATFLRSLDLFLELTVRTVPRTLTTNQVRRGGKQGTDGPELSRIHSTTQHPAITRNPAHPICEGKPGPRGPGSPTALLLDELCVRLSRRLDRRGFGRLPMVTTTTVGRPTATPRRAKQ